MNQVEFSRLFPMGTMVAYYPIIGFPEFRLTHIRSEAWALGNGQIVVKVGCVTGGVPIEAIRRIRYYMDGNPIPDMGETHK